MENIMKIINNTRIRKKRKQNKLTQEQIAKILKIDYKTYNRKENWKTPFTIDEFVQLLQIFSKNK